MARKKKEVIQEVVTEEVIAPAKAVAPQPEATTEPELSLADVEPEVVVPFSAEITIDRKFSYVENNLGDMLKQYPDNLGYIYYGRVYNDTAKHGNHPFKNGALIHTSLVVREEVVDGVTYVHTLNSTYKVRESAVESTTS